MQKLMQYLNDVRSEMAKVTWPTRNELTGATILVIIISIVMALFVFACDKAIFFIMQFLLKSNW